MGTFTAYASKDAGLTYDSDQAEMTLWTALNRLSLVNQNIKRQSVSPFGNWHIGGILYDDKKKIGYVPIVGNYDVIWEYTYHMPSIWNDGVFLATTNTLGDVDDDYTKNGFLYLGALELLRNPWIELKLTRRLGSPNLMPILHRPCVIALSLNRDARIYRCIYILAVVYIRVGDGFRRREEAAAPGRRGTYPVSRLAELCAACKVVIDQLFKEWEELCDVIPLAVPAEEFIVTEEAIQEMGLNNGFEIMMRQREDIVKSDETEGTSTLEELMALMDYVSTTFSTSCFRDVVVDSL